jgi:predicted nucleotide-binding protein (sugar kinase/HSP70/actin superfamily)
MGYLNIPINHMFESLDIPFIPTPSITKRTVELGSLHSPEGVCLPYKLTMGNLLEGIDAGADCLVTLCGAGKCRLGFYHTVQTISISKLTAKPLTFHSINSTTGLFKSLYQFLREASPRSKQTTILYSIAKAVMMLKAIDAMSDAKNYYGPRSNNPGLLIDIYKTNVTRLSQCQNFQEIQRVKNETIELLKTCADETQTPVKVGLLGEFYVVMEPFVNFEIEDMLVKLGVEVKRLVSTGDWAYAQTLLRALRLYNEEAEHLTDAQPYMNYHVGGEGLKSASSAIWCAKNGYDGIIHAYPFGCMPEVVAEYALKKITADYDLPMLALSLDEHSSGVGITTRIEAFIDCLSLRRNAKRGTALH